MKKTIAIVVALMLVISIFFLAIAEPITDFDAYIDAIMSQYEGSYKGFGSGYYLNFKVGNIAVSPTGQIYYSFRGETLEILFTKTEGVDGRRVIKAKHSDGSIEDFFEEK